MRYDTALARRLALPEETGARLEAHVVARRQIMAVREAREPGLDPRTDPNDRVALASWSRGRRAGVSAGRMIG
ncbi:hypothetical protein ACIOMM_15200 [Streptomyces sp. NPDC087908]|uniref:hypothetical protein n=1 Tax=Streptomyces sp. NPDC087908 TaxID=3365820 RepID=UPI0037F60F1A